MIHGLMILGFLNTDLATTSVSDSKNSGVAKARKQPIVSVCSSSILHQEPKPAYPEDFRI